MFHITLLIRITPFFKIYTEEGEVKQVSKLIQLGNKTIWQ